MDKTLNNENQEELEERAKEIEAKTVDTNSLPRYIAVTGILSAAAFVLQYIELAIPIMPSFIKFDFSDLPALIGSFAMGPYCGILIPGNECYGKRPNGLVSGDRSLFPKEDCH